MKPDFANIHIVLINTSHPGNIGSAARAMKTMGFANLWLVSPKRFPAADATMMAAGADDILAEAKVVANLDEAIGHCQLVLGTSARDRSLPWPMVTPAQAAEQVINETSHQRNIAILFGREDKGLSNEELQRCHFHIQIPASADYSSLNLAAAVQVMCYQLRALMIEAPPMTQGYDSDLVNSEGMERMFQHLEEVLLNLDFINPKHPNRIMPRLRRLLNRARLDNTELNILRGILTAIQQRTGGLDFGA